MEVGLNPVSKNGEHHKVMSREEGMVGGREQTKGSEVPWTGRSARLGWKVDARGRGVGAPGWGGGGGSRGVRRTSQGPRPWQEPPVPPSITLEQRCPLSGS